MKKQHKIQSVKNNIQTNRLLARNTDSGRSMVEMLGTLAVIGVLSVAGILGYRYGMTKYQANQITNELNLTSSQLAWMLMRPHSDDFALSLDAPYDEGHLNIGNYAFDFGCEDSEGNITESCPSNTVSFVEEVSGIPQEVCQQTVQLASNLPNLTKIDVNGTEDLTGESCVAENNTLLFSFEVEGFGGDDENGEPKVPCESHADCAGTENPVCGDDASCTNCAAIDIDKPYWTGSVCEPCPTEAPSWNGIGCEPCPTETPKWNGSACEACPANKTKYIKSTNECDANYDCRENADCEDDTKFCKITSWEKNGSCTTDNSNYYTNLKGTCENKTSLGTKQDIRFMANTSLITKPVWKSENVMTWWAAKNWCLAHGKTLLDISGTKLGCYKNGQYLWSIQANSGIGYCTAYNKTSNSTSSNQSTPMQDLRGAFSSGYVWTATDYYVGENSCYAYYLSVSAGSVGNQNREDKYNNAFCEGSPCKSDTDCTTNDPICNYGTCINCADINIAKPYWTGSSCEACKTETPYWDGDKCTICPGYIPIWNGSNCEACPNVNSIWDGTACIIKTCDKNEDCGDENAFCNIISYKTNGTASVDNPNYYSNLKGYCIHKGELGVSKNIKFLTETERKPVWISKKTMTWWAAKNYCLAHGKKLLDISGTKLGCYKNGQYLWSIQANNSGGGQVYCMASGYSASSAKYQHSSTMRELEGFGNISTNYGWTSTDFYPGENSSYVYYVNVILGKVSHTSRHYNDSTFRGYALCEE